MDRTREVADVMPRSSADAMNQVFADRICIQRAESQIAALLPRREDAGLAPRWPTEDVREAHDRMVAIWSDLEDAEGALALPTTAAPDPGIAWAVHRWASGRPLDEVLRGTELAAGDFVRRCKQVIDLLGQLTDAGDRDLQRVARKASDAVLRGVVAADRLD